MIRRERKLFFAKRSVTFLNNSFSVLIDSLPDESFDFLPTTSFFLITSEDGASARQKSAATLLGLPLLSKVPSQKNSFTLKPAKKLAIRFFYFLNMGLSRPLFGDFIFFLWYNAIDIFTIFK